MIVPLPKIPPTKLERFARGFFTPSIRLVQKYAPSMARLEWEYPRLDRFIRAMRAKGYTEDQVKEGVRLLIDRTAEKIAKRKGLEVEQVRPVLEEVLKRPTGAERLGREAFRFGLLSAGAVPTGGMSLPLAAATEGALFAGLETLGKVALGEEVTPKGMAESFALGAVFPPILRGAGRLWRAIRGVRRPPVTAAEEIETLAKRLEEVGEKFTKRIETPEDYDDFLSAITEVFPTEAPERAMAEVMDVAKLFPPPRVLAEEAPERVLEELEAITGGIPRAPVEKATKELVPIRPPALPKPALITPPPGKPYVGLKPGTAEWMRVWREHPELQREMLEYRRGLVPEEMAPPKPKTAPPEVPKEPKVEVPKVGEKGPKEVPKPPVEPVQKVSIDLSEEGKLTDYIFRGYDIMDYALDEGYVYGSFARPLDYLTHLAEREHLPAKYPLIDVIRVKKPLSLDEILTADLVPLSVKARKAAIDEVVKQLIPKIREAQGVMFKEIGGERYAILSPSAKEAGKWQVTFFDEKGPIGDYVYNSLEDAVKGIYGGDAFFKVKPLFAEKVSKPPIKPRKPTKSQPKARVKVPEEAGWQPVESYSRLKPGDYIRVHYRGKVYEGRIAGKPKRMRSGAVMVPLEGGNRKWAPWTPKAKYERKVEEVREMVREVPKPPVEKAPAPPAVAQVGPREVEPVEEVARRVAEREAAEGTSPQWVGEVAAEEAVKPFHLSKEEVQARVDWAIGLAGKDKNKLLESLRELEKLWPEARNPWNFKVKDRFNELYRELKEELKPIIARYDPSLNDEQIDLIAGTLLNDLQVYSPEHILGEQLHTEVRLARSRAARWRAEEIAEQKLKEARQEAMGTTVEEATVEEAASLSDYEVKELKKIVKDIRPYKPAKTSVVKFGNFPHYGIPKLPDGSISNGHWLLKPEYIPKNLQKRIETVKGWGIEFVKAPFGKTMEDF
ncbi:MAG: hypothetical protein DRN40_04475, partial [Thermoplasmata archaeon]